MLCTISTLRPGVADPNMDESADNATTRSTAPKSKNWDELLDDSKSKKQNQKSAACTIL